MVTAPRDLPLIVAPGVMPHGLQRANCKPKVQLLWDMMTATSPDAPILARAIEETGEGEKGNAADARPELCIGFTYAIDKSEETDVFLSYRHDDGSNIPLEKKHSPRIKAGLATKGHLNPVPLTKEVVGVLHIYNQYLRVEPWMDTVSMAVLRITTKKDMIEAWKRWLLRFWAAVFPDVPILQALKKETGDSATDASAQKSKRIKKEPNDSGAEVLTPKGKRRKHNATDRKGKACATQDLESEGSHVYQPGDEEMEEQIGIENSSEHWEKFNIDPSAFDMSNVHRYTKIAESYAFNTVGNDYSDEDLPPQHLLLKLSGKGKGRPGFSADSMFEFVVWKSSATNHTNVDGGFGTHAWRSSARFGERKDEELMRQHEVALNRIIMKKKSEGGKGRPLLDVFTEYAEGGVP